MNVESEKRKIKKKPKKEKGLTLKVGEIVHWNGEDDKILSGFVKTGKEMNGMIKVVYEVGKIFYIPKDKIKVGTMGALSVPLLLTSPIPGSRPVIMASNTLYIKKLVKKYTSEIYF